MKHVSLAALALLAAACGPKTPTPASEAAKSHSYKINLSFTPRTITKLKEMGEKVTISNLYFGAAAPGAEAAKFAEMGEVELGENLMEVDPANQILSVTATKFEADKLRDIEGGEPMLLINVYTARKAATDNLINCGIFQDKLAKAEAAPIDISCDLIEPEPPSPPAPTEPPPPQPDVP